MKLFRTKRFKVVLYERIDGDKVDCTLIIQRRVCFIWITLVDEEGTALTFKNMHGVDEYLNREKKFGETFIIDYRKIRV